MHALFSLIFFPSIFLNQINPFLFYILTALFNFHVVFLFIHPIIKSMFLEKLTTASNIYYKRFISIQSPSTVNFQIPLFV
ncbi:hypothetical protein HanIR_Chr15g0738531 [Helianthus annuus]|nr:hypothetical protein HanIR_Chr15g0738531 [Helianthus annuus]